MIKPRSPPKRKTVLRSRRTPTIRRVKSPKAQKSAKGIFSSSMKMVQKINPELHEHLSGIANQASQINTKDLHGTFSRMSNILGHVSSVHKMLTTSNPQMHPEVANIATHATTAIQETMKTAPSQPLLQNSVDHIKQSVTVLSKDHSQSS
jgi:ERCC4-type nuclease